MCDSDDDFDHVLLAVRIMRKRSRLCWLRSMADGAVRIVEHDESSPSLLAGVIAVYCRRRSSIGNDSLEPSRVLAFAQTQREADALVACAVLLHGCRAAGWDGDLCPDQREQILAQLRRCRFQVLVVTDVAALGSNIMCVDMVVQHRVLHDLKSNIHPVGGCGCTRSKQFRCECSCTVPSLA